LQQEKFCVYQMLKNASRDAFLYDFRKRVFSLFSSFSSISMAWDSFVCAAWMAGGRREWKDIADRLLYQIANVIWANEWLINQNIMSRSDFQRDRFREGFRAFIVNRSIEYLWDLLKIWWNQPSICYLTISHYIHGQKYFHDNVLIFRIMQKFPEHKIMKS
jgi:hypothetical protein